MTEIERAQEAIAKTFYGATNKNWGGLPTQIQKDYRAVATKVFNLKKPDGTRILEVRVDDQSSPCYGCEAFQEWNSTWVKVVPHD